MLRNFTAALTEAGLAREDRVQARAALLPDVGYTTGAIYTEPNGTPPGDSSRRMRCANTSAKARFTKESDCRRLRIIAVLAPLKHWRMRKPRLQPVD